MYSPRHSYGSPPPELSNNPFIDHPANALTRYPDITGGDNPTNFTPGQSNSWSQASSSNLTSSNSNPYFSTPGPQQQQQQQQVPYNAATFQPQQPGWGGTAPGFQQQQNAYGSGFASPPVQPQGTGRPFQPSSAFGQQLAGQLNGGYGVVPQQPPQQQQYTGYPNTPQFGSGYQAGYGAGPGAGPQQQPGPMRQQQQAYLSEFDPYGAQNTQPAPPQGSNVGSGSQYTAPHPREYVQKHKTELESWDSYAWKQVLNSFDSLKEAWASRKSELEGRVKAMGGAGLFGGGSMYGGGGAGMMYGGGQAQELNRLEHLIKEAENNFDSVAASTFQMQEVFNGYRQSGDVASKRRVRESINAALGNLPDWPGQLY